MIDFDKRVASFRLVIATVGLALLGLLVLAQAAAASGPAFELQVAVADAAEPGEQTPLFVGALSSGDSPLSGQLTVSETVSSGLILPEPEEFHTSGGNYIAAQQCHQTGLTNVCVITLDPGVPSGVMLSPTKQAIGVGSRLTVDPSASGDLGVNVTVSGAGAASVSADRTISVGPPLPYDIRFQGGLFEHDGSSMRRGGGTPGSFVNELVPTTDTMPLPPFGPQIAPEEQLKDAVVHLPPGLIGNPQAVARCSMVQLSQFLFETPNCPPESQVGVFRGTFGGTPVVVPVFNVEPPVGSAAMFGFNYAGNVITLSARLNPDDYGIDVTSVNTNTTLVITSARFDFWGVPADASHDGVRGVCLATFFDLGGTSERCPVSIPRTSFLRLPTRCTGQPLEVGIKTNTYPHPTVFHEASFHMSSVVGCERIPFDPGITAQPASQNAETAAGLSVKVNVPNPGLTNPDGISDSDIKKVKVTLPEGVTINPSQGEGLGVCTPAQYESEELSFHPDSSKGCPADSKIGTVSVHSPLVQETLEGSVYVAEPFNNPFNSLVVLYIVIKNPERGIIIKLPGKVEPDERTGQLVTTFNDLPQVPFSTFDLHFREGVRSPLSTPRTCGDYTTMAVFTPWSDADRTVASQSTFQITHGVGGGPCPTGSAPFHPQLQAGSLNNNALSYSPFTLRMIREDGEQEITNFSADLPKGLAAKLAGIPKCSEADLQRTAEAPGRATIEGSICPPASQVGRVTAGYGVGSVQTHATGKVFLAGPYHGTPVSIATVVPAVVGPYDLGTVVQRSAFRVDPETAEVHVDSRASDPIPHILKGIELHLRDLRVYMDRNEFTFNPTNCNKLEVGAFLNGSGVDFTSPTDDPTVDVSNPYQAANCSLLPFKPKLAFKLKGGTHRGDFPALRATLRGRPGDANIAKAVVALPHSEFLEQGHIKTVCTRVQFNADACPAGSIYGHVVATTPLLDHPLDGNVYLRSNGGERLLPDLVMALRGEINVNAVGHIDSVKGGGIRSTFETVPDTPVTKLVLNMQGGRKGLFVNSRNLCLKPGKADVKFTGQNGKLQSLRPVMGNSCKKAGREHRRR